MKNNPGSIAPFEATIAAVMNIGSRHLLRQRAVNSLQTQDPLPAPWPTEMTPQAAQLLFHELRVHQVELELQNEELRGTQRALEEARERYFDLYNLAPVGYCTVNAQELILEANLTAAHLLGVARSDLVRHALTRFMPRAQQAIYRQSCQQLYASGQTQTCELHMVRDDGSRLWVSMTTNVSHSHSQTGAATLRVMFRDISERHQLASALQEKNAALALARHRAESACRTKSDFLTSISRELSAPLKAMLVFAQLMEAGTPAPTVAQQSALAQILQGGWQVLGLVNEVRDLASLESGQAALAMSHEFLADVLLHCQSVIAPQADAAGIVISFPLFAQPCRVQADRQRLAQVLLNLLSNALKTSQPYGKVVVRWSLRPGQRVRLSVRDSGPGLSAEQLADLFQPLSHPALALPAGCGIALVVSQRLVELMGGQMGAHSTPGAGSVFWFELALAPR